MELNEQQSKAVAFAGPQHNILVTAGAGCGKTRTIIARAAALCKKGTDASRILIVTFTNRAAREIKLRLKSEIGESAERMQAGTFHAFCLKVMAQLPKSFDITGMTILDADDQASLMTIIRKSHLCEITGPKRSFPKSEQLVSWYSYVRNTCGDAGEYLKEQTDLEEPFIETCIHIFEAYQAAKQQRGYLDYDDLLERFTSSLRQKPALRNAVCTLFDEVLVDEMQDTNPIQFSILRHFSTEKVRLFCVGDPAQSIYRFRGAEFKHVYEFEQIFGNSITLPLSINYRSNQEIVAFANWLMEKSPYEYRNKLVAARGESQHLVRIENFEHQSDEASWIADYVVEATERRMRMSDMMVLYRSAYEARTLEAELIRRQIPYRFIGGLVLTKSAHVRDLLSLLRVVRNTKDDLAWTRFLMLWPRIGEKTASAIIERIGQDESALDSLAEILGSDHPACKAFSDVKKLFSKPLECIQCASSSLKPILSSRYDHWHQRVKDFELLEKVARNYRSTLEFIDDFTLEPLHDTQISNEHNDDALTLITVHSAKGTEASICIVASATQSNYPHFRSLGSLEAEEEERRVLYVACTRAKDELIITRSSFNRNAFWIDSSPAVGERYFLEEIPQHLVQETLHGWTGPTSGGLSKLKDIF